MRSNTSAVDGTLIGCRVVALGCTILIVAAGWFLASPASAKEVIAYFGTEIGAGSRGGEFDSPGDSAVNTSGAGPADPGDVYVIDRDNQRIQRFAHDDNGTPADPFDDAYDFISAWGTGVVTPAIDEVQLIAKDASSGKFILTLMEQPTAPISHTAGNGAIAAALGALPVVGGSKNVLVNAGNPTGDKGGPWRVRFVGALSATDLPQMTAESVDLSGGAATVSVSPVIDGSGAYEICTTAAECRAGAPGGHPPVPGDPAKNGALFLTSSSGVAVDQDTGRVFISDTSNFRVGVYAGDGTFLYAFGYDVVESGPGDGGTGYEICVAADGDVCKAGVSGSGVGQLGGGGGIAVTPPDGNPATGAVFVVDSENSRINTYGLDGSSPGSFGSTAEFGNFPFDPAVDSRGIVYISYIDSASGGFIVARYDSENANGGGIGFLAPIAVPPLAVSAKTPNKGISGLEIDPDSDGVGPDKDVLYVLRNLGPEPETVVQQFGPVNAPGLTAPPAAEDAHHGSVAGFNFVSGLGLDERTGRLFVATEHNIAGPWDLPEDDHGVYVLDTAGSLPTVTLDSVSDITANTATLNSTIDPNGPPVVSYRAEYSLDGSQWERGPQVELGSQQDPQSIGVIVDPPAGLAPSTLYHVRIVVTKRFAIPGTSNVLTFTTASSPPLVETVGAPVRSATTVTLNGRVNPRLAPTQFHLEYVTADQFAASGFAGAQSIPAETVGVNEVQRIVLRNVTAGQFKLSFEGQQSTDLPFDASPEAVQSALEALPAIGSGNVRVRGGGVDAAGKLRPYTVIFTGELAATDVSDIISSDAAVPLDDDAGGTVETLAEDGGGNNERQRLTIKAGRGKYTLSFGSDTTVPIDFFAPAQIGPESVRARLGALPSIGGNAKVAVSGGPGDEAGGKPNVIEFKDALANEDLGQLSVSDDPAEPLEMIGERDDDGETILPRIGTETAIEGGPANLSRLVAARISGLAANTSYLYRVVANNGNPGSPAIGGAMTVTTRASDAPLGHGDFPGPIGSDRAYEQINLPDTGGNPVSGAGPFAEDGNRAIYAVTGGTPVSETGTGTNRHFAERTDFGWETLNIFPSRSVLLGASLGLVAEKPDLAAVYAISTVPSGELDLWRLAPHAAPTVLWEPLPGQVVSKNGSIPISPAVAVQTELIAAMLQGTNLDPAFPEANGEVDNIYDVSSGLSPQLLSLMPDGEPAECGVSTARPFELSADASRLFFASKGDDCDSRLDLYFRDLDADQTELMSGPVLSGPDCEVAMIRTTEEAAFLFTQSRLVEEDEPALPGCPAGFDGDVYRYDLDSDTIECVTCVAVRASVAADVFAPFNFDVPSPTPSIAVAEDGSRVYFQSPHSLLPGAPATSGSGSLYVTEPASGELRWVGLVPFGQAGADNAMTPDGAVIRFRSDDLALNPVGGSDNGGTEQDYRYDDRDRSLICISCPLDGTEPVGQVSSLDRAAISDDGEHLAFATPTPLVAADQNTASPGESAVAGMDVYEWRDGRLFMITDGLSKWSHEAESPSAAGISPSGRDLYLLVAAQLTPDALDGYRRLYTARIGGGIVFPKPKPPCPLEVCQGTPRGAPQMPRPLTADVRGVGNPPVKPRRCAKGKRKVRRKGQVRCVKRRANRHRRAAR